MYYFFELIFNTLFVSKVINLLTNTSNSHGNCKTIILGHYVFFNLSNIFIRVRFNLLKNTGNLHGNCEAIILSHYIFYIVCNISFTWGHFTNLFQVGSIVCSWVKIVFWYVMIAIFVYTKLAIIIKTQCVHSRQEIQTRIVLALRLTRINAVVS